MNQEKNIAELKIRVPEAMRDQIKELAFSEDRSPSEYVRHVLALHLYGHVRRVCEECPEAEVPNGSSQGPRNNSDHSPGPIGFTARKG